VNRNFQLTYPLADGRADFRHPKTGRPMKWRGELVTPYMSAIDKRPATLYERTVIAGAGAGATSARAI
jgi:hypothetical protein